jgi:hypothetical protein
MGTGLFLSSDVMAVTAFKIKSELSDLVGFSRDSIAVVVNVGSKSAPVFRWSRPILIPMTKERQIAWFDDESWRRRPIELNDDLIVERHVLSTAINESQEFIGCYPKNGIRKKTSDGDVAIVSCSQEALKNIEINRQDVIFDEPKAQIITQNYTYQFKKTNYMLFDFIELGHNSKKVASNSDIYIKSDIRNFFTLHFSSDRIESRLMNHRQENFAQLATLGFYLRVLFLKLTLDLRTDVSFYPESAIIPMVMNLPVDASKNLNRKSGILYSFQLDSSLKRDQLNMNLPLLNPERLMSDYQKDGMSRCHEHCKFELEVPGGEKNLKMSIDIPKSLVEFGLFPWFVDNVEFYKDVMEWSLNSNLDLKNRVGLYFEISGLPRGSHEWNFNITFRD